MNRITSDYFSDWVRPEQAQSPKELSSVSLDHLSGGMWMSKSGANVRYWCVSRWLYTSPKSWAKSGTPHEYICSDTGVMNALLVTLLYSQTPMNSPLQR